jgi:hypothetical protein
MKANNVLRSCIMKNHCYLCIIENIARNFSFVVLVKSERIKFICLQFMENNKVEKLSLKSHETIKLETNKSVALDWLCLRRTNLYYDTNNIKQQNQ